MLPKVLVLASGLTLASAAARQSLCSSENTASSDYVAVTNIYQSISACALNCGDDYTWAVMQDADCWCTNDQPASTVDLDECSTPCPGYPSDSCGNKDKDLYSYVTSSGNSGGGAYVQSATASAFATNATGTAGLWNSTSSDNSTSGPLNSTHSSGSTSSNSPNSTSTSGTNGTLSSTGAAGKGIQFSWVASALGLGVSIAFML